MSALPIGIHSDVPAHEYHADRALSSSIAVTLLEQSPRHAKLAQETESEGSRKMDFGSLVHAVVLGAGRKIKIIEAENFRTKAAQEARDDARKRGLIPALADDFLRATIIAREVKTQLDAHEIGGDLKDGGKAEQTLVWQEKGTLCRARPDWLIASKDMLLDLKTVDGSAHPDACVRRLYGTGADIQSVFYSRGYRALKPESDPAFLFVCVEVDPPYGVSVLRLDPSALALAEQKVEYAIRTWGECLRTGKWPGYPERVCYLGAPKYVENAWIEREIREAAMKPRDGDLRAAMEWQKP